MLFTECLGLQMRVALKKACCVERFLKKHCGMPFVAFALQVLQDLASLSLGRISLHFLPFLCFSKFRWTKATS